VIWLAVGALAGLLLCAVLDIHREFNRQDRARLDLEHRLEQQIVTLKRKLDRGP
jgi:hypothetical protein